MRPDIILAFDTSAAHCAAALLCGDQLWLKTEAMEKGQAERLMPLISDLLAEAGVVLADVTAIGVGTGPGNFTGVRISVAAARGLALGLGVPAIGVTRLEALAFGLPRPVTVVEDARRGEVYVQRFDIVGPGEARIVAAEALGAIEGAVAGRDDLHSLPIAEAIARIASTRVGSVQPRPAPFYLRGADAAPPSDPPPVILDLAAS
ncbi:MAG: tRNA (adenosine(37)-N6)-threonylcarbamoyltransferase complex dimerization subunit type 1 TsaB [Cypionkella sp.]|uniref:tRNA (adenosine(37)-N6)-threonylcarbamoyltransferase complex dimerization subunit type 1 TsaB n=1 Tax=Cypionkella sp. TaxID=2811411 RepID=UPI002ABC110F|nr:tRNA (adenosine(37)-N6)-threonylcarbamoyltransferase complex dimerization subunit type 1 TsaB [Cypionkella sp.]MDZ4310959.1 tRNA (adenosine(37)-N6)-threonylcarbamoyltransferase complex dimerization subunit type 1 TsaB [Cypionkella sp.]